MNTCSYKLSFMLISITQSLPTKSTGAGVRKQGLSELCKNLRDTETENVFGTAV